MGERGDKEDPSTPTSRVGRERGGVDEEGNGPGYGRVGRYCEEGENSSSAIVEGRSTRVAKETARLHLPCYSGSLQVGSDVRLGDGEGESSSCVDGRVVLESRVGDEERERGQEESSSFHTCTVVHETASLYLQDHCCVFHNWFNVESSSIIVTIVEKMAFKSEKKRSL